MRTKAILLSTASYLALVTLGHAADLPRRPVYKAPPPAAVVASTWTGFYIGAHVGGASLRSTQQTHLTPGSQNTGQEGLCDPVFSDAPGPCHFTDTNFIFGGQIGYNWQVQNWVLGVEGDGTWTNLKSSRFFNTGSSNTTGTSFNKLDWMATARARVGWVLPGGSALLYGTGGVAFGGFNSGWVENAGYNVHLDKTVVGWVAGGGIEYKLNPQWSVRAEGLYYDFGRESATGTGGPAAGELATYTTQFKNTVVVGRIGLNLKW